MLVATINVGDRRREDYGDIDGLAASISEHGLLHPIVVDAFGNLVAGGRRLRAVEQLGWRDVPVTRVGELSDAQLREIELEENLRRKDLTAIEASRTMVALAEVSAQVIRSTTERKSNGGRPSEPDSLRSVAEHMGVSPQTVMRAKEHVAAVEANPDLEPLPQAEAIRRHRAVTVPLDPDLMERQQRDTALEQIDRCVYALESNIADIPGHLDWILETRDLVGRYGPLTPSRMEKASAYCAAFAAELRKRGIDG